MVAEEKQSMKPSAVAMRKLRAERYANGLNNKGEPRKQIQKPTPPEVRSLWSTNLKLYYKMYQGIRSC